MLIALTRAVPPSLNRCELTHIDREHVDVARAVAQHARYEDVLVALGCTVRRVAAAPELPDSVFIEDTVVVLPELAIITRPGAASRRPECAAVADAVRPFRQLAFIAEPATLDGGDVLCIGMRILVGRSARTNEDGVRQLRQIVAPFGYRVDAVRVTGCLHLKSAATCVADAVILANTDWIESDALRGFEIIATHAEEPHAANALRIGDAIVHPAGYPRTRERLQQRGLDVHTIEVDELEKAEAGVTCCAVLVPAWTPPSR